MYTRISIFKGIVLVALSLALAGCASKSGVKERASRGVSSMETRDEKCERCLPLTDECLEKAQNGEYLNQYECLKAHDCGGMDCAG